MRWRDQEQQQVKQLNSVLAGSAAEQRRGRRHRASRCSLSLQRTEGLLIAVITATQIMHQTTYKTVVNFIVY